jgi:hypothetical protein
MSVDVDISIRTVVTESDTFFKVIIYDLDTTVDGKTVSSVRDICSAKDYPTAVSLIAELLTEN